MKVLKEKLTFNTMLKVIVLKNVRIMKLLKVPISINLLSPITDD